MREVSDTTGSIGSGSTRGASRSLTNSFTGKSIYEDLTDKANSVPIDKIFKKYGIRLDEYNRKCICPFKSHSGGRERSASFIYYPQTNSYHCFGCKNGNRGVDFVAEMDGISRIRAAEKIIRVYGADVQQDAVSCDDHKVFSDALEIMLEFSNIVRDFRKEHVDDKSLVFIEAICQLYDYLNLEYEKKMQESGNELLMAIVSKLKTQIISYGA